MTSQVSSDRYIYILADAIPDKTIAGIYEKLVEENSVRWLFFSYPCESSKDFIKLVRDKDNLFYIIVDTVEKDLVGVFWLNNRTQINWNIHTAFFKKYYRRSVVIAKEVIKWLFNNITDLESLLCFIPVTNRLANSFVDKVGWNKAGTIPKLIKDTATSDIVAGNMFYITKDGA